jgi:hypothetical protein
MKWQPRNVDFCALASDALVPIVHTVSGITVLHGQFCVQLAMDDSRAAGKSRTVLRRLAKVISFSRAGRTVNEMEVNVQLHALDALTLTQ